MESFGATFPKVFADLGFKGWFVSVLLLRKLSLGYRQILVRLMLNSTAAWAGSLINGPIADQYGRKIDMMLTVAIFTAGSAVQAGAINIAMLFVGRSIAGLAVGMLTMVIPLYISEVSLPEIRGGLVVLQQCKPFQDFLHFPLPHPNQDANERQCRLPLVFWLASG